MTRLMMACRVQAETLQAERHGNPIGTGNKPPLLHICSLKIKEGEIIKMIKKSSNHIKVESHTGTWYVIDDGHFEFTPDTVDGPRTITEHLFLLEHEKYGDEAACVIVSERGKLVLDDVMNGFCDLEELGWSRVQPAEYAEEDY